MQCFNEVLNSKYKYFLLVKSDMYKCIDIVGEDCEMNYLRHKTVLNISWKWLKRDSECTGHRYDLYGSNSDYAHEHVEGVVKNYLKNMVCEVKVLKQNRIKL